MALYESDSAGDGETQVVSAKFLMSLSGHLFHKIHCGTVSIEKDTYLTPILTVWKLPSHHIVLIL